MNSAEAAAPFSQEHDAMLYLSRTIALPRRSVATFAAVAALLAVSWSADAQSRLGDIEAFLMEPAEEIALARSAGPRQIGDAATIWVLTRSGYEIAEEGDNGFHCFVGRGWSGPVIVDRGGEVYVTPDALDASIRAPHCFNPVAAQSVLPWHRFRTDALLAGMPAEDLPAATARALQAGGLQAPGPQAFAYMTSSQQNLGSNFGNWHPHVMLYLPYTDNGVWGAEGFSSEFPFVAEAGTAWAVTVIPIGTYSDGTEPTYGRER